MNAILSKHIAAFKAALQQEQIHVLREKEINYGWQIVCGRGDEQATANFYYGKKGLSSVIQGKEGALKVTLSGLAKNTAGHRTVCSGSAPARQGSSSESIPLPEGTQSWMGCDESGKGDVFGPLVCAACTVTQEEAAILQQAGVCDSKALSDTAIERLAEQIKDLLKNRWIVRVVMPEEYNLLYDTFRKRHQNLNHLLGYLHGQNIQMLLSKYDCPCIIVDKFGKEEYVLSGLDGLEKNHTVIQVPRGERDIAVAAASILARQGFVQAMAELEKKYGLSFPKGAYLGISQTIRAVLARHGAAVLAQVGKLNFKTFDFLR